MTTMKIIYTVTLKGASTSKDGLHPYAYSSAEAVITGLEKEFAAYKFKEIGADGSPLTLKALKERLEHLGIVTIHCTNSVTIIVNELEIKTKYT